MATVASSDEETTETNVATMVDHEQEGPHCLAKSPFVARITRLVYTYPFITLISFHCHGLPGYETN